VDCRRRCWRRRLKQGGPTISAGSMRPRRVPFFSTCSRLTVLATHICKSENLAGKTLPSTVYLIEVWYPKALSDADERQVSSVPMTDCPYPPTTIPPVPTNTAEPKQPTQRTNQRVQPIQNRLMPTSITVKYKKHRLSALIDTGSDVTIASADFAKKYRWTIHPCELKEVKAANEEVIVIIGGLKSICPSAVEKRSLISTYRRTTQGANHHIFVKTDMVCYKRLLYMVGFLRPPATTSGWTTFSIGYCNSEI